MKTLIVLWLLLTLVLVGCSREDPAAPRLDATLTSGLDAQLVAGDIIGQASWEYGDGMQAPEKSSGGGNPPPDGQILSVERNEIGDGIVHYAFQIQVGPGIYDVIGLHRVVKERGHCRPIRTHKSVFMLHGDFKDFTGCFLPGLRSGHYPDDFGIAAYLAQGDVDVWGMDQAHNSIPAGATDFSSMADWDMFKYADDTRKGLAVARLVRLLTGNGYRKMDLLGYSGGAALGFAVVNEETKLPRGLRHVGGFIPVDEGMFTDDPDFAASDCATSQYYAGLIDSGEYVEENPFPLFGVPARDDPDGPSELIDGFTNLQAALAVAVYPYVEGFPYHFLAGTFDADGLPTGLQYTNVDLWIDFMIQTPPFFANAFSRDEYFGACGAEYAPWTDQLAEVNLPVLYVSAGGGFGLVYDYTLEIMVRADISTLTVELHPVEEIELDFGHIDLFAADNAPQMVWQPIMQWIMSGSAMVNEDYPQMADIGR
jgi:hypothetical protein